mgnify:CR=1 FL=1
MKLSVQLQHTYDFCTSIYNLSAKKMSEAINLDDSIDTTHRTGEGQVSATATSREDDLQCSLAWSSACSHNAIFRECYHLLAFSFNRTKTPITYVTML